MHTVEVLCCDTIHLGGAAGANEENGSGGIAMKRFLMVLLTSMLATSLFACSAEPTAEPSQAQQPATDSPMLQAFQRIQEDESLAGKVRYSEENDALQFLSDPTQSAFESALELSKPYVEKATLRIDLCGLKTSRKYGTSDPLKAPFAYLAGFPCRDMELLYGNDAYLDLDQVSQIPTLTKATYHMGPDYKGIPAMPHLIELVLNCSSPSSYIQFQGIEESTKLESISFISGESLRFVPEWESNLTALGALNQLKTIQLKKDSRTSEENLVAYSVICDFARSLPAMESIDGQPVASWTPSSLLSAQEMDSFEILRSMQFMLDIHAMMKEGNIIGGADASVTGTAMVFVFRDNDNRAGQSSPEATVNGDSYAGLDASRFTTDPAACATVILVYPSYEVVGSYTSGTDARRTFTTVRVYDVASKTISDPYIAATTEPPDQVQGIKHGSGDFLPDVAMPYVASLF